MQSVVVALLFIVAESRLVTKARCGPQTEVCTASYTDAASNPQWECSPAVDGEQVPMTESMSSTTMSAKVCGPGQFHFSPMSCAGGKFEYKKVSSGVEAESTTTGCQIVEFPYTMQCYQVNC